MKREEIKEKLKNGLFSVYLEDGRRLADMLTVSEIGDVANTLTAHFPESDSVRLAILEDEVFNNIPEKENCLDYQYLQNSGVSDEVSLSFSFFLSGRQLVNKYDKDIDSLYGEMISYFNSFKINNLDLVREIEENPIMAITIPINEQEVIRVDNTYGISKLAVTNKTIKNFKHLL